MNLLDTKFVYLQWFSHDFLREIKGGLVMNRIYDIYFAIKELFGPKIKVEIINSINNEKIIHVCGDNILERMKHSRKDLKQNELEEIFKSELNKASNFEMISFFPMDILLNRNQVQEGDLVNKSQFTSPSKIVNFNYHHQRFSVILSAPQFENINNQLTFKTFLRVVEENLYSNKDFITEYIKNDFPPYLKDKVEKVLKILRNINMIKIENKEVNTGVIFVESYLDFKRDFHSDLFLDIEQSFSIREIDKTKQPLLEIAHGDNGFLIVDKDFSIHGVMYTDLEIKALNPFQAHGKQMNNCLIAKINGVSSTRLVYNSQIFAEIVNGQIRKRDYSSFSDILFKSLRIVGVSEDYHRDIRNNIIEITNMKKGTIIVIGDQLTEDKTSGGIRSKIKLIINRYNNKYRGYILSQVSCTDGAVLLDKELNVYMFATILRLKKESVMNDSNSGSRSYTAEQFSIENPTHLIIKISEDGPIAIFHNGQYLIEV